jgi:hypothetical protein
MSVGVASFEDETKAQRSNRALNGINSFSRLSIFTASDMPLPMK